MKSSISCATARNWKRLNADTSDKLTTRANKMRSTKRILPLEYFENIKNVQMVNNIIDCITSNEIDTMSAIYTIAVKLLLCADIFELNHVKSVLNEYNYKINYELFNQAIPTDERDLLGIIYQSLSFEGEKNCKGSYYTPKRVVQNMLSSVCIQENETFLDPCCGSGSFLLSANAHPCQLYGMDNDYIAVFICKINLLLKFRNCVFTPQVYYGDFLQDDLSNSSSQIFNRKYDYIITNPPWGAVCNTNKYHEISSNESYSCFFVKSYELLNKNGYIRFLFPESILNVKVHKDIREFILTHGNLSSITLYDSMFSGVTTKYIDIELLNKKSSDTINIYSSKGLSCLKKEIFYNTKNIVFSFQSDKDLEIINKVKQKGVHYLNNSVWALGIVTGNNKETLLANPTETSEPIYTGKEIEPYLLRKPTKYIEYDRSKYQQVAKEEFYRAKEKLVYKFISNKLVFAYDNQKSLFLNSANILIPKIPNMSIKTVMAFLNSELYQYLYAVMFKEVKILKGNLLELPFPDLSLDLDREISSCVECLLSGDLTQHEKLQEIIYDIFNISEKQKPYIKEKINGTFN